MYVGLEHENYKPFEMISQASIDAYRDRARDSMLVELADYVIGQIKNKDIIDAKELAKMIFPQQSAHVFLSHSHRD